MIDRENMYESIIYSYLLLFSLLLCLEILLKYHSTLFLRITTMWFLAYPSYCLTKSHPGAGILPQLFSNYYFYLVASIRNSPPKSENRKEFCFDFCPKSTCTCWTWTCSNPYISVFCRFPNLEQEFHLAILGEIANKRE